MDKKQKVSCECDFQKSWNALSSQNLLTLPIPLKCIFHKAEGSVGRTIEMALESYSFGFKYHMNYLLIRCGNLGSP